jgi:D-glycero-alpha-D-manno-heptose-7-phosphate kinase
MSGTDEKRRNMPNLVMTRTPLRISFAGGGTDLSDFYRREDGAVLSTTINKYVYVTVKRHSKLFNNEAYRLNYAETEMARSLDEVKNDIARECMRLVEVEPPLYISTVADLPAATGLGSSSSFAVGLLRALHAIRDESVSAAQLVEESVYVEVEALKHPIGKQDQAAAAYGGMNYFRFHSNGGISLQPHSPGNLNSIFSHIQMFWTGITRDGNSILREQRKNIESEMDNLRDMRDQAVSLNTMLQGNFKIEDFGNVLDRGWSMKRQLASSISNDRIDDWYQRAHAAGALGGKLCGAGGGGFLMFITPPERQSAVRASLHDLTEMAIEYEPRGARLMVPSSE